MIGASRVFFRFLEPQLAVLRHCSGFVLLEQPKFRFWQLQEGWPKATGFARVYRAALNTMTLTRLMKPSVGVLAPVDWARKLQSS